MLKTEKYTLKSKELRVELDASFTQIKKLKSTRQTDLALTKAQESKMWLGQVLKKLGADNPYPNSKNPKSKVIEPTADATKNLAIDKKEFNALDDVGKIKALRKYITDTSQRIYDFGVEYNKEEGRDGMTLVFMQKSYEYCIESNMWLGMELAEYYNKQNKSKKNGKS